MRVSKDAQEGNVLGKCDAIVPATDGTGNNKAWPSWLQQDWWMAWTAPEGGPGRDAVVAVSVCVCVFWVGGPAWEGLCYHGHSAGDKK